MIFDYSRCSCFNQDVGFPQSIHFEDHYRAALWMEERIAKFSEPFLKIQERLPHGNELGPKAILINALYQRPINAAHKVIGLLNKGRGMDDPVVYVVPQEPAVFCTISAV